jgi:hypothetical protein
MNQILNLIQDFVKKDFVCNKSRYDFQSNEVEYGQYVAQARAFFHNILPNPYNKWGIKAKNLNDPSWVAQYKKDSESSIQRTPFQIRHYRSPQLGDVLREKIKSDELWGCLCSYHMDTGAELDIDCMYFVAETSDGLKIVYDWAFDSKKTSWRQTHDYLPTRVEHAGTLVEVLNLQPPAEPASLGEYLNPTHSAYTMIG